KGASLAQLRHLADCETKEFCVPNGLVVTTIAFRKQVESIGDAFETKVASLCQMVYGKESSRSDIEKSCDEFSEWFSQHPLVGDIKTAIRERMSRQFGQEAESKPFAVRSSAAMEDSSEMSAAGQMTTFLGVKGLDNVCSAVVRCWASQYGFVPIEYKRGYGQELSSPM